MDARQAMLTIAQALELAEVDFDAQGQRTFILAPQLVIHAARIDAETIEWSVPLPDIDFADPAMMAVMLEANCLGAATGAGRLSVDRGAAAYFGERWILRALDDAEVQRRFGDLAATAAYWLAEGSDRLLEEAAALRSTAKRPPEAGEAMIMMQA